MRDPPLPLSKGPATCCLHALRSPTSSAVSLACKTHSAAHNERMLKCRPAGRMEWPPHPAAHVRCFALHVLQRETV